MPCSLRSAIFVLALGLASVMQAQRSAQPLPSIPDTVANLADQPATHTGFTFDRSTIESIMQQVGPDGARAAAALASISFDTYHYKQPAFYTPEAMHALIESYRAAGWKHMVNGNQSPANSAQPTTDSTDLWLHFSGADIDHVTVLIRQPKNMNLIQVAGDLRPLDLIHLSGHFGIPRVDPNAVMVPAPDGR